MTRVDEDYSYFFLFPIYYILFLPFFFFVLVSCLYRVLACYRLLVRLGGGTMFWLGYVPASLRDLFFCYFLLSCTYVPHSSPFGFKFDVNFLILFFSLVLRPCPRFVLRVVQRVIRISYVRYLIALYILV